MPDPWWQGAGNLLCVRLDYLGDVLMCTPAMRALHAGLPGCRLTLLTSESAAGVAPHIPELAAVIAYPAPWLKASAPHPAALDLEAVDALRARHFDAAVVFTTYSQSALPAALLCYLAGIPLRLAHCRENPYQLLTDWVPETEPHGTIRHEVQRQLDLVAHAGFHADDTHLSFALRSDEVAWAAARLRALGIDAERPWVLIHPGASAPSRRYPAAGFAAVAGALARQYGYPIVFTGSADESGLIQAIMRDTPAPTHSLAGEPGLGQLGALISLAPVMVCNNTGPAHIAAALGTPLVDLYALTNPQHTPWQVPCRVLFHDVPCRHCYKSVCPEAHHDCLRKVAPGRVVEAVCELLAAHAATPEITSTGASPAASAAAAPLLAGR